jgi:hypothetical protein
MASLTRRSLLQAGLAGTAVGSGLGVGLTRAGVFGSASSATTADGTDRRTTILGSVSNPDPRSAFEYVRWLPTASALGADALYGVETVSLASLRGVDLPRTARGTRFLRSRVDQAADRWDGLAGDPERLHRVVTLSTVTASVDVVVGDFRRRTAVEHATDWGYEPVDEYDRFAVLRAVDGTTRVAAGDGVLVLSAADNDVAGTGATDGDATDDDADSDAERLRGRLEAVVDAGTAGEARLVESADDVGLLSGYLGTSGWIQSFVGVDDGPVRGRWATVDDDFYDRDVRIFDDASAATTAREKRLAEFDADESPFDRVEASVDDRTLIVDRVTRLE